MRAPTFKLALSLLLPAMAMCAYSGANAQVAAQVAAQASAQAAPDAPTSVTPGTPAPSAPIEKSTVPEGRYEQRAERIHIEDSSTAIDELKVGGETKSITVQPKNSKLPEYEILQPRSNRAAGAISRDGSDGAQQPRVWSLKKF